MAYKELQGDCTMKKMPVFLGIKIIKLKKNLEIINFKRAQVFQSEQFVISFVGWNLVEVAVLKYIYF